MRKVSPAAFTVRRYVLAGLCALPLTQLAVPFMSRQALADSPAGPTAPLTRQSLHAELAKLEAASGGRLGVAARLAHSAPYAAYHGDELFPLCSTFKVMAAAAILRDHSQMLSQKIVYEKKDMQPWSPVTEKHMQGGLTIADLCAAILQHSDNTAANLILRLLGGPEALTAFARSLGDDSFHLDHYEVEMNAATPKTQRDSSTPMAMCNTLAGLLCGNLLPEAAKKQLTDWMLGCATGATRIPAGMPQGWRAAHKTGGWRDGSLSTANDIGVLIPPADEASASRSPLIVSIYLSASQRTDPENDKIIASATRLVCAAEGLAGPNDDMY